MNTKQLRQKILDLAIRGKLVPQDPSDEPASVLLARVKAEKERLIAEGKIKRSKKKATTADKPHYPFEIPDSWEWATIGEIASSILYGVNESAKESGTFKLLRITDIHNNRVNWQTVPFTNYDEQKAAAYLLRDGDILFARTGATVGKSYLVEGLSESSIYASYLIRVQTSAAILPTYTKLFFESGFYWEQISLNSVGVGQPNVNGTTLASLLMPIPPYQEQKRIVEESKKWLSIIDGLDFKLEGLMESLDIIKSKILHLAINGKLVAQDPVDEPAEVLLKRVNPNAVVSADTSHYKFDVPKHWTLSNLGDLFNHNTGKALNRSNRDGKLLSYITTSNLYWDRFELDSIKQMYFKESEIEKCTVRYGDLLVCEGGDIGRSAIWSKNYTICIQNHIHKLRPIANDFVLPRFYYYCFLLYKNNNLIGGRGIGIQGLSSNELHKLIMPLPPFNEQKRIVAKIDELFAVIDQIQQSLE